MKRFIKKIGIICSLIVVITFIMGSVKVKASSSVPTKSETLQNINTAINISEKDYSEYTDDEEEVYWANFYGVNIYNYCEEDYGFCGFYMDYAKKPTLLGLSPGEASIHGDDPIIYLIPRELFIHRGTYTYVGKEYGFFVNTRQYSTEGDLETANLVDVFIFDIITSYTASTEKFSYTIKPLYIFTYIYLSDYIFYTNDEVEIDNIKISLDSSAYSSYSDAIIPIPRLSSEKHSNQYGNTYIQNYEETQPNRELYAIKDTVTFVNLTNAHSYNKFDSEYNIDEDKGYSIRRSYTIYKGAKASQVNVTLEELHDAAIPLSMDIIGAVWKPFGAAVTIAESIVNAATVYEYFFGDTYMGYELATQTNNPSDSDKGARILQKENDGEYWKFDAKGTRSSATNSLVFRAFTRDEIWNEPIYEYISYNWSFECEQKEQAYLVYGSKVQIAIKNDSTDTYNEISNGYGAQYIIIGNEMPKEVTILNHAEGYMLQDGINDKFSFVPQYSGYYKINAPSYSTIKLYENDNLVKTQEGTLSYIFDKNKLYTFDVIIGSFPQDSRAYHVSISPYQINACSENLLDTYIKDGSTEGILKLYCSTTNMYNIELYYLFDDVSNYLNFEIFDENMQNVEKLYYQGFNNQAVSIEGINSINILLESGKYYYICYEIINDENVYCNISEIDEEYNINVEYSNSSNIGDKLSFLKISNNSNYEIKYHFNNQNTQESNMYFVVLIYRNNTITTESFEACNGNNGEISKKIYLYKNDVIYFGYFNGIDLLNYTFSCYEKPNYLFTITTENSTANEETGLGTEITVNNGARYDTTIAVGFTRVLYLGEDAEFSSRYNDYIWSSSNPTIATVSAYGTVFAKKEGFTTIRVIDKYNLNHVATLEIEVYEMNSQTTTVILSTDMNEDPSLNGTEVRLNGGQAGGTTISVGYTRSICIIENGPTNIRQDYIWSSSNTSIATVDQYGIVHAKSSGIVTIKCVNKYDNSYIGEIIITVV